MSIEQNLRSQIEQKSTTTTWEIGKVRLTKPNGEIETYRDWASRGDFIDHLEHQTLEEGKLYLFGFQRNYLCHIDKVEIFENSAILHLTQVLDLDDTETEFTCVDGGFNMRVLV